jgi:hypothetical protein
MKRPKMDPESTAHHEAGHFVAAYFLGTSDHIDGLTVQRYGMTLGANHGEYPLAEDASFADRRRAVIELYAGAAAHLRLRPREKRLALSGGRGDSEKAAEFLGEDLASYEPRFRAEATSLVDEHWAAVTALAKELMQRKQIDSFEAQYIVAIAEGEEAQRQLVDYRRYRP